MQLLSWIFVQGLPKLSDSKNTAESASTVKKWEATKATNVR